ncbi:MAG: hypothetical protein PVG39_22170 [Desulfobacteraceae bacterium]|jgi:hypothetical protein
METTKRTFNNITSKIFNILDDAPGLISLLITLVIVIPFFS